MKPNHSSIKWIATASFVFCLNAMGGQTEFTPVQQRAQGRSLTGANLLNDSLYANPASAAFTQAYAVDASFQSVKSFSASVLDTKTSSIGGALGFYRLPHSLADRKIQGARLAMMGRVSDNIGIGLAGKMVWSPDVLGVDSKYTDLDLGVIAHFGFFQLGASTHNLFGGDAALGEQREYSLGAQVNWEETVFFSTSMKGDGNNMRPLEYGFGAQYVSPYHFALKGGYRIRTASQGSFWSLGASVLSEKVSLHYSIELPNQGTVGPEHMVATTVLF